MENYNNLYHRWLFDECEQIEIIWKCPCGKIGNTEQLKSHYGHIKESESE